MLLWYTIFFSYVKCKSNSENVIGNKILLYSAASEVRLMTFWQYLSNLDHKAHMLLIGVYHCHKRMLLHTHSASYIHIEK